MLERLKFERPLWEHQFKTAKRFEQKNEMALLHEMGTGKTTSAIAWFRCKCFQEKKVLKTLIVSPIATLWGWEKEFQDNTPENVHSKVIVVHDKNPKKKYEKASDETKKIFIVNQEALTSEKMYELLKAQNFECVIVDESQNFKSHKSKRLKKLLTLSDKAAFRAVLTGTLILNSYEDIWAVWRILDKGTTFGDSFFHFRHKYFRDANAAWKGKTNYFPAYVPKPRIESEITSLIDKKASRLTKLECLDLPPLVKTIDHVEMTSEQAKMYRQMLNELVVEVKQGECVATNALVKVLRLMQISAGFLDYENDVEKGTLYFKDNPKLAQLKTRLIELTPNHKVIVWTTFRASYDPIRNMLRELKIDFAELTGDTKDRSDQIFKFQNDHMCRVMLSNPQAGGVGITLTKSDVAIYYSCSFKLGDRLQSEARNHRGGSEIHDKVTLIDIVAKGTIDEDVREALNKKEDFANSVLDRLAKMTLS